MQRDVVGGVEGLLIVECPVVLVSIRQAGQAVLVQHM
jgi:hypothetical protein